MVEYQQSAHFPVMGVNRNTNYRTLRLRRIPEQAACGLAVRAVLDYLFAALRDTLKGVRSYLCGRIDFEPNPYYKGRYSVALLVCAYNHVSHPYEVAEIIFRNSRLAKKIDRWLTERCERFPYLAVRRDGTVGDWKEPQIAVPKKPAQSELPEKVRVTKASGAHRTSFNQGNLRPSADLSPRRRKADFSEESR